MDGRVGDPSQALLCWVVRVARAANGVAFQNFAIVGQAVKYLPVSLVGMMKSGSTAGLTIGDGDPVGRVASLELINHRRRRRRANP